ncbi:hypothetical protein B0T17DRAFT_587436 [Bombardia bombarda]|uniref:C2H2-type domain-containing protein n=1 Tax=Bombardia bombarda TaxID=252184 RepID=A0AA39XM89_9PEZI|nr:hypothetical protein B0T17DRAFT_587436 [Bombardia bombarda]
MYLHGYPTPHVPPRRGTYIPQSTAREVASAMETKSTHANASIRIRSPPKTGVIPIDWLFEIHTQLPPLYHSVHTLVPGSIDIAALSPQITPSPFRLYHIGKLALTAHPPAAASWDRWPQTNHSSNEYAMMDAGVVPYDSRPVTSPPLQPPATTSHFFSNPSFSAAPMTSMTAPHYSPPVHVPYGSYSSYSPSLILSSPFKHHQEPERPQLRIIPSDTDATRASLYLRDSRRYNEGSRSPSVKSDSQMSSAKSVTSNRSSGPRVITSNVSVNGASQVEFNTHIDALMKAIQAKKDAEAAATKMAPEQTAPELDIKAENLSSPPPLPQEKSRAQQRDGKLERKRYPCDIPGCTKSFTQKTHLDTHRRAHTGDKPFTCMFPNCGWKCSQLGNLRTHERRHSGEKPYCCDQCGKRFAQLGNVRQHLTTHNPIKPFICKLDRCNKTFTQLGNLKFHQNKFHVQTLEALLNKFATAEDISTVSKDDREMREYFASLYKNSNKGIKGRGKHRKVQPAAQLSPVTPHHTTAPSHFGFPTLHGLPHVLHTPHNLLHGHPHQGLSHPASYSMSRPHLMAHAGTRDTHNTYEMFDTEESVVGSGTPSPASGPIYDEDHGRDLAFGDRMY